MKVQIELRLLPKLWSSHGVKGMSCCMHPPQPSLCSSSFRASSADRVRAMLLSGLAGDSVQRAQRSPVARVESSLTSVKSQKSDTLRYVAVCNVCIHYTCPGLAVAGFHTL